MLNIWNRWNQEWFDKHDQGLAYNKAKTNLEENTDIDSLSSNYQTLKDLNPFESDSVVVSAAELGVTPPQYYEIYKNSNTLYKTGATPNQRINLVSTWWKNTTNKFNEWLNEETERNTTEPKKIMKTNKELFFVGVDTLAQIFDRGAANFGSAMAMYEDEIYRRKGLNREDNIEFERKGINKNQREWLHKLVQGEAFFKAALGYGAERFGVATTKLGNLVTPKKYDRDPYANTPYTDKVNAYLISRGAVDAEGKPLLQKTDANAFYQAIKGDVMDDVAELKRKGKDVTAQDWLDIITTNIADETQGNYQTGDGFMSWFEGSDSVMENRARNEMLEEFQLSTNIGDFGSYLVTGNMPGRYAPENVIYESKRKEYENQIMAAELAFRNGEISVDEKNTIVAKLEDDMDEALSRIGFEPNKGVAGVMGGILNMVKYYYTDPFIIASKGFGLGGKFAGNAEVFASAQLRMKEWVDEGNNLIDFWAKPENDEVLSGVADAIVNLNKRDKSTAFLDYVNTGINAKFSKVLSESTDPNAVKKILQDGLDKQYLSDMIYGTQSIGNAGQYRLQAKVLDANLLKALADTDIDNGVTALGRRGGSRKSNSLFQNIKELFNGTDVRLAVKGEIELDDINNATITFARMGNLLKVPETRLNKLLTDFYTAIDEGRYFAAQEIYWDGLIRGEGALQMKYLYGFSDNEIKEMFGEMGQKHRMFTDETARFVNPSKDPRFYDPDEIHIFAKRQAQGQFEDDIPYAFLKQTIEMFSQLKMNTIEVPDIITLIKATTQKRRLRAKYLIEKEGIDRVFQTARDAFDRGVSGTFWDETTPLGKIIAPIAKELDDPNVIFSSVIEGGGSAIERGAFGLVRSVFYPLQLLFRLSYPAKLALEGNMRVAIFGARSIFRSPLQFVKHMLNDPNGNLAKVLNVDVTTSLQGPFVQRRPIEFGGKWASLNDKIPMSLRKALGVLTDNAEYGFAELGEASSASPMWTFRRNKNPNTQYELVNKLGRTNVPMDDGVADFVLDESYIEAYREFIFEYIDDDLAAITAGLIKQNYSIEDIAKYYQETPAVRRIIEEGNKMMQSRNVYQSGTLPIVSTTEDFFALAKHYKQLIDNYTGKHTEFIDIIATGKIGNYDLRAIDSVTPEAYSYFNSKVSPLVKKYRKDLPDQIPRAIPDVNEATKFQNFMDAIFYATAQVEADLIRIPFIRQAYDHFIKAAVPNMTPEALRKAINNHMTNQIPVNLSDEIIDLVKKEYDSIKNLAPNTKVTERTVPVKIFENKVDGEVVSYSVIAYSPEGQLSVETLKNLDTTNNVLTLDLNIYNSELKVFKTQSAVAAYRLGDDGQKIGVYNLSLNKNETIVNGVIPDREALINAVSKALAPGTNAEALVDDAIEYLAKSQGLTTVLDKNTLFKLLGIDNHPVNLEALKLALQKGKVTKFEDTKYIKNAVDVGPATIARIVGDISPRNHLLKNKEQVEKTIEEAFEIINKNKGGFSIDIDGMNYNLTDGYTVSPYQRKSVIIPLNETDDIPKEIVEEFIKKNKSYLKKNNHVLGGWVDKEGLHLDVSVYIAHDTNPNLALAKAQYLGIMAQQKTIGLLGPEGFAAEINTRGVASAFDSIRLYGQELLVNSKQKRLFKRNQPIVSAANDMKIIPNDVLEAAGIKALLDKRNGIVQIFKPNTSSVSKKIFSGDYQSMLDLSDIKSSATNRVLSYEEAHERAVEYAMEIHSRILYNLMERGYFSQAYRVGFAFFEAYREVLGRYMNLALANPKAAAQLQLAYRKGLEQNYIYVDPSGDQYLVIPVGGTPFEDYVKSEGRGVFTDDMSTPDSKIIAKRTYPLNALLVGGTGLMPPLGPVLALGIGPLINDKPKLTQVLQKTVFGGFPIESAQAETYFSSEFGAAVIRTTMPSVGRNMLQTIATNSGTFGMDEDAWLSSVNTGFQIAAIVRPDLADNYEELEEVAMTLATNYYQLKTWDRFINPFVPRLSVMYAIEGNETVFWDWYGKEGEDTGLEYNNFVELAVIHGFYQDLKDEYVMLLGPQGEYYALYEITKLLGLDKNSLAEDFTTAALQVKGKNISEAGRMPRTKGEYNFILDNPELAADYGPVLLYFYDDVDKGATDYGAVDFIKNLGLFKPKTKEEFYVSTQTFLASAIESAQKDYWSRVIDNATLDPEERRLRKTAKFAEIDINMKKYFPMAYGVSSELNKVLGSDYETGIKNDVLIDYLYRAVDDSRLSKHESTKAIKTYLNERDDAINGIIKGSNIVSREQAINFIINNSSPEAQRVREQLFTKAQEISRINPNFLVVFEEVFSYELTRYGLEG